MNKIISVISVFVLCSFCFPKEKFVSKEAGFSLEVPKGYHAERDTDKMVPVTIYSPKVNAKDDYTSSEFLFRAALYAESLGKTKEAIEMYKKIKSDYPLSEKAADADRYLARLGDVSE